MSGTCDRCKLEVEKVVPVGDAESTRDTKYEIRNWLAG